MYWLKASPALWKSLKHWISWFVYSHICYMGNCRAPADTMCTTEQKEGLCPKGHFKEKKKCVQVRNRSYRDTQKHSHAARVTNRCRCYTWGHNAHQFNENMAEKKLSKLLQEKTTANNCDGWKTLFFFSLFFFLTQSLDLFQIVLLQEVDERSKSFADLSGSKNQDIFAQSNQREIVGPKAKKYFWQNNLMKESIPPSPINKVSERAGLF